MSSCGQSFSRLARPLSAISGCAARKKPWNGLTVLRPLLHLNIPWHSKGNTVEDSLQGLSRYCEQATEIQLSYYHEDGRDEIGIVFVGPSAESIHEAQRRRMVEDISNILSRQFNPSEVAEVVTHVNELFSRSWLEHGASEPSSTSSEPAPAGKGRKHLH